MFREDLAYDQDSAVPNWTNSYASLQQAGQGYNKPAVMGQLKKD